MLWKKAFDNVYGKLEDNDAMGNHRIMAAVIGAIMKLPGAPRALAVAQLKSRYLENLIGKMG